MTLVHTQMRFVTFTHLHILIFFYWTQKKR